jgi:hypothetical protein
LQGNANNEGNADNANNANNADNAGNAGNAGNAENAGNAGNANYRDSELFTNFYGSTQGQGTLITSCFWFIIETYLEFWL